MNRDIFAVLRTYGNDDAPDQVGARIFKRVLPRVLHPYVLHQINTQEPSTGAPISGKLLDARPPIGLYIIQTVGFFRNCSTSQ